MFKWKVTTFGNYEDKNKTQELEAERWYDNDPWTCFVGPDEEGAPILAVIATRMIFSIELVKA